MVLSHSLPRLAIIELDTNNELRIVWFYPSISNNTASFLLNSCNLKSGGGSLDVSNPEFTCTRFSASYQYALSVRITSTTLSKVVGLSLIVLSDKFEPQKSRLLGSHLLSAYVNSGSTVPLMKMALQLTTKGERKISDKEILTKEALDINSPTRLANILDEFNVSGIHLYTAMILHKRIIIHVDASCTTKDDALSFIISLLSMLPIESEYPDIYSYIRDIEGPDYAEMLGRTWFIGVVFDSRLSNVLSNSSTSYDLLISYEKSAVTFSDSAKENFATGKLHKDISRLWADVPNIDEDQIIKKIQDKTSEVIAQLSTIASAQPDNKLSESSLLEMRLARATSQFLLNLGRVHGFDVMEE